MRVERQFNMTSAKLIEVKEPDISTELGNALGIKVRFNAASAADGLAIHMTPEEARQFAHRLLFAVKKVEG